MKRILFVTLIATVAGSLCSCSSISGTLIDRRVEALRFEAEHPRRKAWEDILQRHLEKGGDHKNASLWREIWSEVDFHYLSHASVELMAKHFSLSEIQFLNDPSRDKHQPLPEEIRLKWNQHKQDFEPILFDEYDRATWKVLEGGRKKSQQPAAQVQSEGAPSD